MYIQLRKFLFSFRIENNWILYLLVIFSYAPSANIGMEKQKKIVVPTKTCSFFFLHFSLNFLSFSLFGLIILVYFSRIFGHIFNYWFMHKPLWISCLTNLDYSFGLKYTINNDASFTPFFCLFLFFVCFLSCYRNIALNRTDFLIVLPIYEVEIFKQLFYCWA